MKGALADQSPTPFRVPPGIDLVPVDPHSGALVNADDPSAIQEAFKSGTEPGLADEGPVGQVPDAAAATNNNPGKAVDEGTGGLY
jgi:penicillin-binding protein 1A